MPKHAENFATKLQIVREAIKMRFPSMDMQKLAEKMSRLGHYHYDKKRFLIMGEDRDLYNFLIENSYNPYTLYRWLLLERIPDHIKWQLKNNQINQKQAITLSLQRRKENGSTLSADIKALGMKLIGGM